MRRVFCIALLLAASLALAACTTEPIKIGGFSVAGSPDYSSDHGNSSISANTDGHDVTGCDTIIMKKDSELEVAAAWHEGITFEDYKNYLKDSALSSENNSPDWFSDSAKAWVAAEKRIANEGDLTLKDGTRAFLIQIETLTELGNPYSFKSKEAVSQPRKIP